MKGSRQCLCGKRTFRKAFGKAAKRDHLGWAEVCFRVRSNRADHSRPCRDCGWPLESGPKGAHEILLTPNAPNIRHCVVPEPHELHGVFAVQVARSRREVDFQVCPFIGVLQRLLHGHVNATHCVHGVSKCIQVNGHDMIDGGSYQILYRAAR
jgi:hypothetical protein